MAVSVSVVSPAPAPTNAMWVSAPTADLGTVLTDWSATAGAPRVSLPAELVGIQVGQVSVKAQDLCTAVQRLVSALRYTSPQPRLTACDSGQILVESATN